MCGWGWWENAEGTNHNKRRKISFLLLCQYKLHYLICGSRSPAHARPPSLRGDQASAVTCQSSPDRQWPCSALLETIWIDLAFSSCFRCRFPRQLACKRGAMPNKIELIGSKIKWFTGFKSEGTAPEMFIVFLYSLALQIHSAQWWCFWQWMSFSHNGPDLSS